MSPQFAALLRLKDLIGFDMVENENMQWEN